MKIGIIGSGDIGSTAARRFTEAGHEVAISNSRGPESLTGLVKDLGANARAATVSEAATFGDIVLEAIPFGQYRELSQRQSGIRSSSARRTTTRIATVRSTNKVGHKPNSSLTTSLTRGS